MLHTTFNGIVLTIVLMLTFGSFLAMRYEIAENKDGARAIFIMSLFGLAFALYFYISDNRTKDALLERFKLSRDIYCRPNSFEAKNIKVNRADGWYLEDDILKNKSLGYSMSIERCSEGF